MFQVVFTVGLVLRPRIMNGIVDMTNYDVLGFRMF